MSRKGYLSDHSVLAHCPENQHIPFKYLQLAARNGRKISRPQSAKLMFENLNMPQLQKNMLIEDFVLRAQKAKPLVVLPTNYNTLSLDKINALVTQNQYTQTVAADLYNAVVAAIQSDNGSYSTNGNGSEYSEIRDSTDSSDPQVDVDDAGIPFMPTDAPSSDIPSSSIDPKYTDKTPPPPPPPGFIGTYPSPQPPGGRVGTHTHFPTPAGSGASAARSTPGHFANPIQSGGTSSGIRARQNLVTGQVINSMQGQPEVGRGRVRILPNT